MVIVKTAGGAIEGTTSDGIDCFLGIPYAHAPIGSMRFKHAQLKTSWSSPYQAMRVQAIPPQPQNKLETFFSSTPRSFVQDEDCLYLNIWRQANDNYLKPVIIYFYGGGFINGHGTAELYTPEHIVEQEDVIVVTFNYRLGALGYLDWSYFNANYDKNNGLSDQLAALKWVHTFIDSFGGDPNNVTLMGQSAGSMSIMALMQMPLAVTYFKQVLLLSGTLKLDSADVGTTKARHFKQLMEQRYGHHDITLLHSSQLLQLMDDDEQARGKSKGLELIYAPIATSDMSLPLQNNRKPMLVCTTHDEGDIYITGEEHKLTPRRFTEVMALYDIYVKPHDVQSAVQQSQIITYSYFLAPALHFLKHFSTTNQAWLARFDWCIPLHHDYGSAYHILDVIFWFGKMDILAAHQVSQLTHARRLSRQMIRDLAQFARTGTCHWQPYSATHQQPYVYK